MVKKGYNWKSRQAVKTIIDNSETNKIQLDLNIDGNYDHSNALVLPSKKRKTKVKSDKTAVTKLLTRKQRKRLEKIVEKKRKKENRSSLLAALESVQATPEELNQLTSIKSVQTKGLKRYLFEEAHPEKTKIPKIDEQIISGQVKLNSLSGAKRRQLLHTPIEKTTDPNVVGFDSDSDDAPTSESEPEITNETPPEIKEEPIEPVQIQTQQTITPQVKSQLPPTSQRRPAVFVDVIRDEKIQTARLKLPILAEEQQIMETINENPIVIIAGETGSGKTTQVPQFLYEAGYALQKQIAVTEPRRVAAISMSKRVGEEMNLTDKHVSYLIRFEGNATEETRIKFMTDGVLLKEIQNDFLLSKYSVIILDEAHERSVYTDILIGLLSRIVPLRNKKNDPLKLIIMSATLRIEDFTENQRLFKQTPPVIKVETRQFPVTIHFNKRTNEDYLKDAFNKACKVHMKLPEGGMLIFLTGQQEVNHLVKKLRRKFPYRQQTSRKFTENTEKRKKKFLLPEINLDDFSVPGDTNDLSDFDDDITDSSDDNDGDPVPNAQPLWVLPLYSMLPTAKQSQVFQPPPLGCRLCIISTNVAETSLTIPNIKYVIDSGKTKVKLYDKLTGVTSHVVTWTSKASADQRAGRAGRMGPGHCYRLYSSAVFNDICPKFTQPEIQIKPIDDLYLLMKCMHIDKIENFPFPTAPDLMQIKSARKRLEVLEALVMDKVTPLGRAIVKFPVLPRFGKMLALSHQQHLLPYTICLVAAFSVQEVLLERPITLGNNQVNTKRWMQVRRKWAGVGNAQLLGDAMVLLRAVGAAEYANTQNKLEQFCQDHGLRYKALIEIRKLRLQLSNNIKIDVGDVIVDPQLRPPSDLEAKLLRQILLSGLGDQIAKKYDDEEIKTDKSLKLAYHCNNMEEAVFIHSSSVLKNNPPDWVIYQEVYETNKIYIRGITAIEPEWLPVYVPHLCNLSAPLTEPEPCYKNGRIYCTVTGTFGPQCWALPPVEIPHPKTIMVYKWFGRYLLAGDVFGKLAKYKEILLSQPGIMVKSWAKLQPRTDAVLKALASKDICSKSKLEEVWQEQPKFLLEAYLQWLPQSAYSEVSLLWPPLD